jgi:hypothetical protein
MPHCHTSPFTICKFLTKGPFGLEGRKRIGKENHRNWSASLLQSYRGMVNIGIWLERLDGRNWRHGKLSFFWQHSITSAQSGGTKRTWPHLQLIGFAFSLLITRKAAGFASPPINFLCLFLELRENIESDGMFWFLYFPGEIMLLIVILWNHSRDFPAKQRTP